jgi:hypothetical protein
MLLWDISKRSVADRVGLSPWTIHAPVYTDCCDISKYVNFRSHFASKRTLQLIEMLMIAMDKGMAQKLQ